MSIRGFLNTIQRGSLDEAITVYREGLPPEQVGEVSKEELITCVVRDILADKAKELRPSDFASLKRLYDVSAVIGDERSPVFQVCLRVLGCELSSDLLPLPVQQAILESIGVLSESARVPSNIEAIWLVVDPSYPVDLFYLDALPELIRRIPSEDRIDVIRDALPLMEGIADRGQRLKILNAVKGTSPGEREQIVGLVRSLTRGVADGEQRLHIFTTVREIRPEEREQIAELARSLMRGIAGGGQRLQVLNAVAKIPKKDREKVVADTRSLKKMLAHTCGVLELLELATQIPEEERESAMRLALGCMEGIGDDAHRLRVFYAVIGIYSQSLLVAPCKGIEEMRERYWALGEDKWKEIYDGKYHEFGKWVFDGGLHGQGVEPGYLRGIESAFACMDRLLGKPTTEDMYLGIHKIGCAHFRGRDGRTLIVAEDTGRFRGSFNSICWYVPESGLKAFSAGVAKQFKEEGFGAVYFDQKQVAERGYRAREGFVLVVYRIMEEGKVRERFCGFLEDYHKQIQKATSDEEKLRAIALFTRHCQWLHTTPDGCGRLDLLVLNKHLVENGFSPAILDQPYLSSTLTFDEWVGTLKKGMERWKQVAAAHTTLSLFDKMKDPAQLRNATEALGRENEALQHKLFGRMYWHHVQRKGRFDYPEYGRIAFFGDDLSIAVTPEERKEVIKQVKIEYLLDLMERELDALFPNMPELLEKLSREDSALAGDLKGCLETESSTDVKKEVIRALKRRLREMWLPPDALSEDIT